MTPSARIQAAIEILDEILSDKPAEQALTGWARRSRYAGSKDRRAVRDHVFDALRSLRSLAALGGSCTGRGLMIGACVRSGADIDALFSGMNHAPDPVSEAERAAFGTPESEAQQADIPDWLWPEFRSSLGPRAVEAGQAMQSRAPVHLRVNLLKSSRSACIDRLRDEGIETSEHPVCGTALEVQSGERRIAQSEAYLGGYVELQDAASQAVVAGIPLTNGMRVLDYCAGGGGKTLALAAHDGVKVFAHDAAPQRMRDLPNRAARAGVSVRCLDGAQVRKQAPFDVVLVDAPCSGSGSWRRAPAGKWSLTQEKLEDLVETQAGILRETSKLVASRGFLIYATCSILDCENRNNVDRFLADHPDWKCQKQQSWSVLSGTDGFYCAHLTRTL